LFCSRRPYEYTGRQYRNMPRRIMVANEDYYMAYKILKDNDFELPVRT